MGSGGKTARDMIDLMKVFLFVLFATIFEATGDAVLRIALHHPSLISRVALFVCGGLLLTLYGTSLNLAPVEFGQVVGIYIAMLFIMFQISNLVFFRALPSMATVAGGVLIVVGGLLVGLWR
jgi:small multidrug resistance family-3 protein